MALRIQKNGKQKPWTLEELAEGLTHFYNEHGRYPTAPEIDAYQYLPSARSIERRFGGVVALRKEVGLDGQSDFRTGEHSSKRAETINNRAHKVEGQVYNLLIDQFGEEFVHREYFFSDDRRTRADFFVYDTGKGFCVDVFFPSNRRNLSGCLNSKIKKYADIHMRQYPVIFLQMNEDIRGEHLEELLKKKKIPLAPRQQLMEWKSFQEFCSKRNALRILKEKKNPRKVGSHDPFSAFKDKHQK